MPIAGASMVGNSAGRVLRSDQGCEKRGRVVPVAIMVSGTTRCCEARHRTKRRTAQFPDMTGSIPVCELRVRFPKLNTMQAQIGVAQYLSLAPVPCITAGCARGCEHQLSVNPAQTAYQHR